MIKRFIEWFISPSEKFDIEDDVYSRLLELEERIEVLEAENIENSNCFYELTNSIDAIDARIDILITEKWIDKNV
jgi:ATP-dependent RNA circularization protein (DNA/RNA ligase family)